MRYFKSLVAFIALILATSCAVDNIDGPIVMPNDNDLVTVIGRVARFTDCDVDTRGVKNAEEGKITSMAMALFPLNDNGTAINGSCEYFDYKSNQNELLFTIERGTTYKTNTRYAMYIFCNIDMSEFSASSTLDAMLKKVYSVENLNIPANGFPMIGSLGDTFSTKFDKDNQVFILSPMEDGKLTAPKVDGKTQTLLTIPMKAMYAKVNFTIEVTPDQTIDGNYSPMFSLNGCTINNAANRVDFDNSTNDDTEVIGAQTCVITGNTEASGANKIKFSFYLPERLLQPATSAEEFNYPFGTNGANIKGYSNLREEDKKYAQRFKSQLLGSGQLATNVVIEGQFRDHQNHHWDVTYTIYLGEDNYGNFNIRRNYEYNNFVTIRGIQTSSDMSDNTNGIAIDHRVNIERTQPAIISLRREVLLDSHFEVRPLRIRKSDIGDVGNINAVKVEVLNPTTTNWMRLERSFGDGTPEGSPETTVNGEKTSIYIDDANSASYGKRKFFTYNLIDGVNANAIDATLKDSTEVIVPLNEADECVWIYVDECTESGDGIRAGIIQVTYGNLTNGTFTPTTNSAFPIVNYTINQRKLFAVSYQGREYCIEFEEEYLHNFDADDNYGNTEFQGMEWGLKGQALSYDNSALFFDSSYDWIGDIINALKDYAGVDPKYDYYVTKHDTKVSNLATKRSYAGYDFCKEIIQVINGQGGHNTDVSDDINVLALNQQPRSAIEYCYNKNKRNNNGQVAWTGNADNYKWYLPATDEIEDIVMSDYIDPDGRTQKSYGRFIEFQSQYYWSSQPAYIRNYARYEVVISKNGEYYLDDVNRARATSVSYDNGTYSYTTSGVDGYYHGVRVYNDWFTMKCQYYETGTLNGVQMNNMTYQPGNQLRTEKNRIRCVRMQ